MLADHPPTKPWLSSYCRRERDNAKCCILLLQVAAMAETSLSGTVFADTSVMGTNWNFTCAPRIITWLYWIMLYVNECLKPACQIEPVHTWQIWNCFYRQRQIIDGASRGSWAKAFHTCLLRTFSPKCQGLYFTMGCCRHAKHITLLLSSSSSHFSTQLLLHEVM